MISTEIYHVAVMPPAETSGALLRSIAAIMIQPDYQIRLQLAGKIPKIIGHFRDQSSVETAVCSLKKKGLAAFVINESELRHPVSPGIIPRSIKFENDSVIFSGPDGSMTLNTSDVFLILTGRRSTVLEDIGIERSTMKVNVPATLLTGGIPIMKRVISKAQESEKITEQFIRLYRIASDFPAVELRQFELDYSFLGNKMDPTATCNIVETAVELRRFFDKAYFNDILANGFVAETNSITGINIGEQSCLLLVRYYQAIATRPV